MYQWEYLLNKNPKKDINEFSAKSGTAVLSRYQNKKANTVQFRVYVNRKYARVKLIGPFNDWGRKQDQGEWLLKPDSKSEFYTVSVVGGKIKHKTPYLYFVNGKILRDPASAYFDKDGNSVFWDFDDPSAHYYKFKKPDLRGKSVKILQTDLPGLVTHFENAKGNSGWQIEPDGTFDFIRSSGVIKKIKDLGFNAIQFLPVARSIDGGKWSLRYLVPYLYSINNYWGTPDDFAAMVDKFHEHGIAIIVDLVVSHAPYKDYRLFGKPADDVGIHLWQDDKANQTYLDQETNWGTKRYRIADANIRSFVNESALFWLKHYRVSGFRIDNVDGILRYGDNGDGRERPNGREFLRELTSEAYKYDPSVFFHFEAHYFYKNNAKWLVQKLEEDKKALGATAYTSSRLTYHFHAEYMPFSADKLSVWKYKHINDEQEWGESASTIADFHNHDAAAGLMSMRATGSYAYDALTVKNPDLHYHAVGKIKVMEALISFLAEGRTLDLLQSLLLQTGSFEHDSTIHWQLVNSELVRAMLNYKKDINKLLDQEEFWPINVSQRKIINLDDINKCLTFIRSTKKDAGKHGYLVHINISGAMLKQIVIPAPIVGDYKVIMNSDLFTYAGSGRVQFAEVLKSAPTNQFELFPHGLHLTQIAPYGIVIFKY